MNTTDSHPVPFSASAPDDEAIALIQSKIYRLPGRPDCMLAQDLAEIYETKTERINQDVKRNPTKFPPDFYFQLTDEEMEILKSQNVILKSPRANPYGFTEEGCHMLATVLKTPIADERSVQIIRAFVLMRKLLMSGRVQGIGPDEIVVDKYEWTHTQTRLIDMLWEENARLKNHRRTYRRVDEEETQEILSLKRNGYSTRQIADQLNRPIRTIQDVVRRHRDRL